MTRWKRIAAVAPLAVLVLVVAAPARADDCLPVLDLCDVDDVVEETVEETVETVTDTTTEATESVGGTVEAVLGEDPVGDAPPPGNGGGGVGGAGDGKGRHPGDRARNHGLSGARAGGRLTSPAASSLGSTLHVSEASIGVAGDPSRDRSFSDRLATAAAEAAKSIATVLVLLGVAVGFVVIQDRLDKKDPKLALAPARSDVVRFD